MKIAVTYQDGMVFQHFGHSQQFKLYEVENGKVIESLQMVRDKAFSPGLSEYHSQQFKWSK